MKAIRTILIVILFFISGASAIASEERTDTLSIELFFRRGVAKLEREFNGNGPVMDGFLSAIRYLNSDPSFVIHSVNITATASPEGRKSLNDRLARDRAQNILEFLRENTTLSPSQLKVNTAGENWKGLVQIISECSQPWKMEALAAIAESGVIYSDSDTASEQCKARLQAIAEGTAWNWMNEYAFGHLRCADGSVMVISSEVGDRRGVRDTLVIYHKDVIVQKDTVYHSVMDKIVPVVKRPAFRKDSLLRQSVFAVRSNFLLPLMNVGIEVPVSNRFSLGADFYYPWAMRRWMNEISTPQMNCMQALAFSLEGRIWLGSIHNVSADRKYRLRGHSIGIIATGGYYDIERNGNGQQGEFYALGADYMYALPLGKGGAHMELSIGAGCAYNPYRNYDVRVAGGHLIGEGPKYGRFVPVPLRVGVSVVIPITKTDRSYEK